MFSANSSQVSSDRLYVEDVFSTWLYTGNSSTQTITNGIDLAGKGGLVWFKQRSSTESHGLFDTARGVQNRIQSNNTNAEFTTIDGLSAFNSNGFSIGSGNGVNASSQTYASWTFREAPKFFDVVTYTGNGANRNIAHSLGVAPGCIIVKRTDTTADWQVYHRSNANTEYMVLNTTAAKATGTSRWNSTTPTATEFTVGTDTTVNANGGTYVAYLFAHDTTSDGIIQCGSVTADGSGNATASLGWEPQWLIYKYSDTTGNWRILDNMRGWVDGSNDALLSANTSDAESSAAQGNPTATGFSLSGLAANKTFIYIAIRRGPMRTPTSGTSVFSPNTFNNSDGTLVTTGFPIDLQLVSDRGGTAANSDVNTRLLGVSTTSTGLSGYLVTSSTQAFTSDALITKAWNNTSFNISPYWGNTNCISWNFRRAPSFFDVVCYTGTGVARTINHNLGVAPELMIVKRRDSAGNWLVYSAATGATKSLFLNFTDASATFSYWSNTAPTASVFSISTTVDGNASGGTYAAYLFASCPGVSKVGSYTGNGSSQTINCGFAAGARFVMIKRTDDTGDWYVWDTARGIVSGNDPYLRLNSTAAEVTTNDSVDTDSSGFVVNQLSATNINVNAATYLYMAVA